MYIDHYGDKKREIWILPLNSYEIQQKSMSQMKYESIHVIIWLKTTFWFSLCKHAKVLYEKKTIELFKEWNGNLSPSETRYHRSIRNARIIWILLRIFLPNPYFSCLHQIIIGSEYVVHCNFVLPQLNDYTVAIFCCVRNFVDFVMFNKRQQNYEYIESQWVD